MPEARPACTCCGLAGQGCVRQSAAALTRAVRWTPEPRHPPRSTLRRSAVRKLRRELRHEPHPETAVHTHAAGPGGLRPAEARTGCCCCPLRRCQVLPLQRQTPAAAAAVAGMAGTWGCPERHTDYSASVSPGKGTWAAASWRQLHPHRHPSQPPAGHPTCCD